MSWNEISKYEMRRFSGNSEGLEAPEDGPLELMTLHKNCRARLDLAHSRYLELGTEEARKDYHKTLRILADLVLGREVPCQAN